MVLRNGELALRLKNLLGLVAMPCMLLFSLHAYSQAASPASPVGTPHRQADPALWVVRDSDTTIYLFGTVHVLKPGLSWFDSAVKAAFDKSDTLVLEMVEPDPATMQGLLVKSALAPSGAKPLVE